MTLEPGASTLPGLGLCFLTLPVFEVAPLGFLTLPSLQSAFVRTFLTALSFLPLSLGTVQAVYSKLIRLRHRAACRRGW